MSDQSGPPAGEEIPTLSSNLLHAVQSMDAYSWSRLVNSFGPVVYRWCRASGVKESDAADIVQNVFASVARGIGAFERQKEKGSFRSWLATITRNRVRDYFRDLEKRDPAVGGTQAQMQFNDIAEVLDSTICPEAIETPLVQNVLAMVRAEFEPKTWQAFWLNVVDCVAAKDVADELDMTTAGVYQAKSRVLRRLRKAMSDLPQ